jgi:hypothetical protein
MNALELKRVAVLFQMQNARNVSIIVLKKGLGRKSLGRQAKILCKN